MVLKITKLPNLPLVSIVIPTLNRQAHLKKCLFSLFKMNYHNLEIIVVDNGCNDGTEKMISLNFPAVKFIKEQRKGVVFARNTGIKHAKGDIIAFTDDDCIVDSNWVSELISGFSSPKIGAVGGPVFHLHPEEIPEKFWCSRTEPLDLGKKKLAVKMLITGNLSVRSSIIKKIQFDESLLFHDSEDIDFCKAILDLGYQLFYIPSAIVYHDIDAERINIIYITKRAFFSGISRFIIKRKRINGILIPRFLRDLIASVFNFLHKRKVANFYRLVVCFTSLLSSIFLIIMRFE